jgi:hypothetical protein
MKSLESPFGGVLEKGQQSVADGCHRAGVARRSFAGEVPEIASLNERERSGKGPGRAIRGVMELFGT